MKSVRTFYVPAILAALSLGVAALFAAAPEKPKSDDPYVIAVNQYIDAASAEIGAIGKQVQDAEKIGKKKRLSAARESLASCEALIARLKTAGRADFDLLKAEYERTRKDLIEKVNTARTQ